MKRVCVLGCGPSGLLAAHAAKMFGCNVDILSLKIKSKIHGAQYLHEEIEGLRVRSTKVEFIKVGTQFGYAEKVYGDPDHPSSWDKFEPGFVPAWSMQQAYDALWRLLEIYIQDEHVTGSTMDHIARSGDYDLLINTIPRPAVCRNAHTFESRPMYVMDGAHAEQMFSGQDNDFIIYNGMPNQPWYRFSRLFGRSFLELPHNDSISYTNGYKPTKHNCDCHKNWLMVGRFGVWAPGVLVHHAYRDTVEALNAL